MIEEASRLFFERDLAVANAHAERLGWIIHRCEYPLFDVSFTAKERTTLRLKIDASGWNEVPPSVVLLAADGGPIMVIPTGGGHFHPAGSPSNGGAFICMAGIREYHRHGSHIADSWENYKSVSGYDLTSIIKQIHGAWWRSKS